MNSEFPAPITKLFDLALARMGNKLPELWAENKTQFLISYSGGKDSSILVLFWKYLVEKFRIQTPTLFYLSHGIRSIETEEKELFQFLESTNFPFRFVKKKSQIFL
ncbi:arginosuccinate synthase [Leptospira kanakyensis]|uniref:Arginosuccinate synthase n=1 Tax=Leptospira kanakyensis TaxID=2484968 RepID=A0A6N4PV68_9LEPT|nr:ATP-binding protein [Leptospira kanakyensis]TGK47463.1 arginosuccinate synthase [Leptospira kanakyensis]TGK63534.1 arginosuccinate synthase [Leptospira kanakyensis]TGK67138.1 arginosuccinate synthase [Leptospira kanakyensis]